MLLIFGFKSYASVLAMLRVPCPRGHELAAQRLTRIRRRFTLFWVPLVPAGTRYQVDCTWCGLQRRVDEREAEEMQRRG